MSDGITARLRQPLQTRADLGAVLSGSWSGLTAAELARRPVVLDGQGPVPLGDLFEVTGAPAGHRKRMRISPYRRSSSGTSIPRRSTGQGAPPDVMPTRGRK